MSAGLYCYAVDSKLFAKLLKKPDAQAIVEAIESSGKKMTAKVKKELKLHWPWIEKIIAGVPAKDDDPFGEEEVDDDNEFDEDQPEESQSYIEAFNWLCEQFGAPVPTCYPLGASSIIGLDYFGYTEALKRFDSPFPLPKFEDVGTLVGYIPKKELKNFRFKPISKKRAQEILKALGEIDAAAKGDKGFAAFFAERMAQYCIKPEPAEIEIAQSDLAEVFADVHNLGKDFLGFIVSG
jgi:hypothetical protein